MQVLEGNATTGNAIITDMEAEIQSMWASDALLQGRHAARLALGAVLLAALAVCGCSTNKVTSGGKTDVYIADASKGQIASCKARMGAATITESDTNAQALSSAGLPRSMAPLVRQLLMHTQCFAVVERGAAFQAIENEQKIREQQGLDRNYQIAAMTAADYVFRAEIVFVEQTGDNKGALGALWGGVLGGFGAESQKREALVSMSVIDARTSEIVTASFGRGTSESSGVGSLILGGGLVAAQGGWLDTPQAKPVAAALVDAWNQLLPRLVAARANGGHPSAAAQDTKP
jgi:curli biogenesis system outer membrane secretion channel CsgG